ncbi:unnamed protein product [Porites lobata]|uniref:DDE Tnp4 domain-containing protein n=1 Tax=Porites lobata TaxID=104759 RepID=A0ABN8R8S2_9CNID|nr:unnamed protein product [Porites lobata]
MTPKYIRFPVTDVECLAAMATFNDQPIPNCVGTIDGSHIRIIRPHNYSTDYYNLKGYYSVLLQAVCDGNCKFLSLSCGHPGSIHDATMMRISGFTGKSLQRSFYSYRCLNKTYQGLPLVILGDSEYTKLPWLLVPYAGTNITQANWVN